MSYQRMTGLGTNGQTIVAAEMEEPETPAERRPVDPRPESRPAPVMFKLFGSFFKSVWPMTYGEYEEKGTLTDEEQQVRNMSSSELDNILGCRANIGRHPVEERDQICPDWRLGFEARAERNRRAINERMNQAGYKNAAIWGAISGLGALVLNKSLLWGAAGAFLGYGAGRFKEAPKGSW